MGKLKLFVALLAWLLLVFLASGCVQKSKGVPKAVNGVLDLTSWDLGQDGSINLDGEWEFYWHQLLDSEDFTGDLPAPTGYFTIPGAWNDMLVDGLPLDGNGYATFRLKVKLSPDETIKAVNILNQATAYALWINGKAVAHNGVVGKTSETTTPQLLLQEKPFYDDSTELELILQVANFDHRLGGVWTPLVLRTAENILFRQNLIRMFDLMLFGSLLIMGLYHINLYLLRKEDKSYLYFGVFTLDLALRVFISSNYYLTLLFPTLPYWFVVKAEMLVLYIPTPFFILFISSVFNRQKSSLVTVLFCISGSIFSLITIVATPRIVSYLEIPNQLVILIGIVYSAVLLTKAVKQGEKGALIVLISFFILSFTIIIDILISNRFFHTMELLPLGVLFMIFSQSFVLSSRFAKSFKAVQSLSLELEQKNIDLQEMDIIKDEFLANTSHELRTPLSGIMGITESLLTGAYGELTSFAKKNLDLVMISSRRLTNLVNDLLDFSRLKHNDLDLNLKAVDLRTLVDTVLALLQSLVQAKGLNIVNKIPNDFAPVLGDEDRLQQIFYNLLGNAIKFTEEGSITVEAFFRDSKIEIKVSDTGIGIPANKLDDIFLSFERAHLSADTQKYGGTGLGLAITKKLVELHSGTIKAESKLNQGSVFHLTLPASSQSVIVQAPGVAKTITDSFMRPNSDPIRFIEPTSITGNVIQKKYSILVVDDEPINLQVAVNQLMSSGFKVQTATRGARALEIVQEQDKPDLVILDIMMPGMTGYEVCQSLREDFSAQELPVIMLTAKNRVSDLVKGFDSGANDYLTKPFSREELLARVNSQLQLKESYQTLAENVQLRKELVSRQETERDLLLMQRRLSVLLDTVEDAVLAVNQSEEIAFTNRSCLRLLDYETDKLLGCSLWSVVNPDQNKHLSTLLNNHISGNSVSVSDVSFTRGDHSSISANLIVTTLELEDEVLSVFVLRDRELETQTDEVSIVNAKTLNLITELNLNQKRLRTLEESLNGLLPGIIRKVPSFQTEIKTIDAALDKVSNSLLSPEKRVDRNQLAVSVMNLCIQHWNLITGTDKFELARQSGLWKVYINKDGWERTQTLDRYLDLATLPEKPRWKMVISTAEFVLNSCTRSSQIRNHLETTLVEFRLSCP